MLKFRDLWMPGLLAVAATGFTLAPSLALAQDDASTTAPAGDNGGPSKGGWDHPHGGWGGPMGGFKEMLGLTDDQESQLKDLFKSQMEESKMLRDKVRLDTDMLRLKLDGKASDDEIKDALDKLKTEKKEMQAAHEKFQAKLDSILTPRQQAQMMLDHGHRGGWGRGGMMGGRPGFGGGHGWHKGGKGKDMKGAPQGGDAQGNGNN